MTAITTAHYDAVTTPSGTIYRSRTNARVLSARAHRLATAIAVVLVAVGAGLMIAGFVGVVGLVRFESLQVVMFGGLGLVGIGSGALLLMVLQEIQRTK